MNKRIAVLALFFFCGRGIWQMIDEQNKIVCYINKASALQSMSCLAFTEMPNKCTEEQ